MGTSEKLENLLRKMLWQGGKGINTVVISHPKV
jgi:hypothetical protein